MSSDTHPFVSIIIVSWNALEIVKRCLPSVVATNYPAFEIVFADNASTDGTAEWIRQAHPGVRVIQHPENWGFCRGNNRAIEQVDAPYLVLLNNDVEVEPDWLSWLMARAGSDPGIAAVQPKMLAFEDRSRFEYAGASGGHLDRFGYPFARGRVFFELERDLGQYDDPTDIFWASGAAMLLRRSALEEVGLLDESFEFHMEEIDLCWRLQAAGYRIQVEPRSRVYHMGGGSLAQTSPRKTMYNFRNSLLMLYKNLSPEAWRRTFPMRMLMDAAAAARFLLRGEWAHARAVWSAYSQAHRMKSAYVRPSPAATVPPSYGGSIVWAHWARGIRTFAALNPLLFRRSVPASPSGKKE